MERAGRWLALRPRTERELRDRLLDGGFRSEVVTRALDRLRELRLVDDLAYARQWIEERAKKGRSAQMLAAELGEKGIPPDVIQAALEEAAPEEQAQATEVAAALLRKLAGRTLQEQATRLYQGLARRGFSEEAVDAAVRAVLPPEGWD